jgi:ABC-type oligopeptide transport system ATPase subunit
MDAILEVKNLTKHFPIRRGFPKRVVGALHAVDEVSFAVRPGETFGLVGESRRSGAVPFIALSP